MKNRAAAGIVATLVFPCLAAAPAIAQDVEKPFTADAVVQMVRRMGGSGRLSQGNRSQSARHATQPGCGNKGIHHRRLIAQITVDLGKVGAAHHWQQFCALHHSAAQDDALRRVSQREIHAHDRQIMRLQLPRRMVVRKLFWILLPALLQRRTRRKPFQTTAVIRTGAWKWIAGIARHELLLDHHATQRRERHDVERIHDRARAGCDRVRGIRLGEPPASDDVARARVVDHLAKPCAFLADPTDVFVGEAHDARLELAHLLLDLLRLTRRGHHLADRLAGAASNGHRDDRDTRTPGPDPT